MPNGTINVSYNRQLGMLELGADLELGVSLLEEGTDTFGLDGYVLIPLDDTNAIRFLTTFSQEQGRASFLKYNSREFGTRLMWRRTLGKKQWLELGPFFNHAVEDEFDTDEAENERSHSLQLGMRLDYRLDGFRLTFMPEYGTSYSEEGWETGSVGASLRFMDEWKIKTIPIASLLRYINVDRLGVEAEYRTWYYIEDKRWRYRTRGNFNLMWDVNDETSIIVGAGIIYNSKAERLTPTVSVWLAATLAANWELRFGLVFGDISLSNNSANLSQ